MNLYLISQNVNNGYGTFSDAIVCAESDEEARLIHPYNYGYGKDKSEWSEKARDNWYKNNDEFGCVVLDWAFPKDITVKLIGTAHSSIKKGVVLASFHAG